MPSFNPKKAGEEADAMIQQLNQVGAEGTTENQAGEGDAIVTDSADAGTEQQGNPDTTGTEEVATPPEGGETDPGTSASDAPAPPAEEQPETDGLAKLREDLETANQRWRVLQGMIEKKDEELDNMRALFAQLQQQQSNNPGESDSRTVEAPSGDPVTAEDEREFGHDQIDLIRRIADHTARNIVASFSDTLDNKLGELEGNVRSVGETTAKTAEQQFLSDLHDRVPDWEQFNHDPNFLAWLNHVDKFTGTTRLELLRQAQGQLDAHRVASFFEAFKEETQPAAPPAPEQSDAPPAEGKGSRKPDPRSLVSPGKSRASTPKPPEEGNVWTREDIAKLYDDKMRKAISQEEFEKRERDLFKAQSEGRIHAA